MDERSNYYKIKLSEIVKKTLDDTPENEFFEDLDGFISELGTEIKEIDANIQKILKGVGVRK